MSGKERLTLQSARLMANFPCFIPFMVMSLSENSVSLTALPLIVTTTKWMALFK
jgi:hypothetical protein